MIAWFARHQTAANLMMAAIMILGIVALPGVQRETFPEIQNDKVQIQVIYLGATADEVEDAVCRRIEDALESISDLDEMLCDAREGVGTATAVMREGANMTRFLDDVKSEIDAIYCIPSVAPASASNRYLACAIGRTSVERHSSSLLVGKPRSSKRRGRLPHTIPLVRRSP